MSTFKRFTVDQHTEELAKFLPDGNATAIKFQSSNIRDYLSGKSVEFKRFNDTINTIIEQLDPTVTTDFIERWESAIGIPDECIPVAETDQERRDNIVLKMVSLSLITRDDYIRLAEVFGFTIVFVDLKGFDYTFDFTFEDPALCNVSPFDYTFDYKFQGQPGGRFSICIVGDFDTNPANAAIFQCLVRHAVPGYSSVFFQNS